MITSADWGTESTTSGFDRDRILLKQLLIKNWSVFGYTGKADPNFFLKVWGSVVKEDIPYTKVGRKVVYKDGLSFIYIEVGQEIVLAPDHLRRQLLADLILPAATILASHIEKKFPDFPGESFCTMIKSTIDAFMSSPELPPTSFEKLLEDMNINSPERWRTES